MRFCLRVLVLATVAGGFGGCSNGDEGPAPVARRPVTVVTLQESAPASQRLIPAVVTPHRETQIPFEVTGRVERILNLGEDVDGEQVDRSGELVQAGAFLAELDPKPFERALVKAQQRLEAARKQLAAQVVQLETVLPARLESAKSQAAAAELNAKYAKDDVEALVSAVDLARTTLERNRELLPTGAVSDIAVRQSETNLQAQRSRLAQARTLVAARERENDAADAAIAELEGSIQLQTANNEAQRATIKELEEAVEDAQSDLEDSVLRAPYAGRVTARFAGEGSFVRAGEPVVTLTMMNPIEVVMTVSGDVDEELVVGTDAMIYPSDHGTTELSRGLRATLYQKRGIADPMTRTFELGLILANKRRGGRSNPGNVPQAPYLIPVFENPLDLPGQSGLFTVAEAIGETGAESWVLKVRGLEQGARSAETLERVLEADKVAVSVGSNTIRVASFGLVEIVGDGIRRGDLLVPMPTEQHAAGFVVADNRWVLRPGDLVQVGINRSRHTAGFYVGVQSIRVLGGQPTVFVVGDGERVKAVPVEVRDSVGERRRIESAALRAGDRVVERGAHFLIDGDPVTVATDRVEGAQ